MHGLLIRLAQLSKWTLLVLTTFFLFIATGIINLYFDDHIKKTCQIFNSTSHFDDCFTQRQAMFMFIIFCVVRVISYKFECFLTRNSNECLVKKVLPGRHLGGALGIPYLTRTLSLSIQLQATPIFLLAIFLSTSLAFYPYAKDLGHLCKFVVYGIQRRFYKAHQDLIITIIILYLYFSILLIEILDISIGLYCNQQLFGIHILFPNVNFPILLYILHSYVLTFHKKMPVIIYEVNQEDCFVQLHRLRCLCQKDCAKMSRAFRLPIQPSLTTTVQRRELEGRIVQVRDLRELETILPCSIRKERNTGIKTF